MQRLVVPVLLLAGLACGVLSPAGPGSTVSATSIPTTAAPPTASATPAYIGQFDCYGQEGGLGAYAGRVTLDPGGRVTFKDYDGQVSSGAWTTTASANNFTFTGSLPLASAVYQPAGDLLEVILAPNAQVVHTEGGMHCQRAQPGITGPP